jgi:DNA-binding NarL/FixJ family response regulator
MLSTVRVVIADDHRRSREGLRALLATTPEIEIVGEAADGREAVQVVEECRPDVVVLDARMPVMNGLEAARQVKERCPGVKVILLTMYKNYWPEALAAGVDTFLVKGEPVEKMLEAVLACWTSPHQIPLAAPAVIELRSTSKALVPYSIEMGQPSRTK